MKKDSNTGRPNPDCVRGILLFKRGLTAPIHAGLWSLVGGKPNSEDKSAQETAIREMREELRICDKLKYPKEADLENVHTEVVKRQNTKCKVRYFSFELDLDLDTLSLERSEPEEQIKDFFPGGLVECEGLSWFTLKEIHQLPVRPEDLVAINKFCEKNGT